MLFSGGQIMAEMSPQTVPVGYESDSATYGGDVGDSQVPSPSNAYSSGLASFDILDFSSLVAADDWGQTPTKFPTSALFDMKPISEIKREAGLPSPPCSGHIAPIPATSTIKMEDALVPELSLAQVHSLALEQVKRDIHETCDALQIASDPFFWSVEDVRAWINLTLRHYHLPAIPLEYFNMDGSMLCSLSEEEFRQRAALGGDTLYAQLDIWKTACASSNGPGVSFRPEESVPDIGVYSRQWGIGTPSCPSPASSHTSSVASPSPPDLPPPNSECSSEGGSAFHSDDENDDGCDIDKPTRTGGGGASHSHIHLWQFLKELLTQPHLYGSCIRWLDRAKGVYKIEDSVRVARLWGRRKNRPAMNYDKLSRSIRQYYKKGIMKKTERSQRLVYQFCHPYCL